MDRDQIIATLLSQVDNDIVLLNLVRFVVKDAIQKLDDTTLQNIYNVLNPPQSGT